MGSYLEGRTGKELTAIASVRFVDINNEITKTAAKIKHSTGVWIASLRLPLWPMIAWYFPKTKITGVLQKISR